LVVKNDFTLIRNFNSVTIILNTERGFRVDVQDVGEIIPFSKKAISGKFTGTNQNDNENNTPIKLKDIWPEPTWLEMLDDGVEQKVIATVYGVYHSLVKMPHRRRLKICGISVSDEMWEKSFIEVINVIKSGCENATSLEDIDRLRLVVKERYPDGSIWHYKQYAAGIMTKRSFRRVFHGDDYSERYTRLLPHLDFPATVNPKNIKLFPVEMHENDKRSRGFYRLCEVNRRSYSYLKELNGKENKFSTYTEAAEFLNSDLSDMFSVEPKSKEKPFTPKKVLDGIKGVGEYYTRTPEELMIQFGFRGIQFGNYLPQKERVSFVSNTHYAFTMLSELLGIPKKWIGAGDLGLSFGARGHGFASAHYEPEQRVINLTRFNGAGCISHEWCHSLDSRLMKKYVGTEGTLSDYLVKMPNGFRLGTKNDKSLIAFMEIVKACTEYSDYTTNARNISRQSRAPKYWDKPCELVARAFESYVQDSMVMLGAESEWLAFGTLESNYKENGKHPYPTSSDRIRINEAFSWFLPMLFQK